VQSPSQQDNTKEKYQLVEKLFAALEGRPRAVTGTNVLIVQCFRPERPEGETPM